MCRNNEFMCIVSRPSNRQDPTQPPSPWAKRKDDKLRCQRSFANGPVQG
jgi:hypothetical protein